MAITKIKSSNITDVDASKLTGSIADARVPASAVTQHVTPFDPAQLEMNMAVLAFKVASANQLTKFNMVDQVIDEYQDATGIDAGNSTNELASGSGTSKYYEGASVSTPTVTGGTTTVVGDYTYHAFTSGTTNYVTNTTQALDFLVIAGGGSGGYGEAGGGGAGGLIYRTGKSVAAGTYAVTVGVGGVVAQYGTNGSDSTFGSLFTAKGGGYGGTYGGSANATDGGSGGGSDHTSDTNIGDGIQPDQAGESGTYGFGNDGGQGDPSGAHGNAQGSGGGGGAGGAGGTGSSSGGGAGGLGKEITMFNRWGTTTGNVATSGTDGGWFASGGGGSRINTPNDTGVSSAGGGGNGGVGNAQAASGLANTGGGGGGAGYSGTQYQGAGGSGIVVIRRLTDLSTSGANLTLQSTATTAESAPTSADLVVLIEDGAGTATVNTDIKGYISRDGSAFSSAVTFVDEGDWGTNKRILVARNVDISGIASGTSMKYKLTTHNQSAGSKETRIHATSLAWA